MNTPADPVEMNTVVLGDLVKTIKLQKEVLGCDYAIADFYLFTELLELATVTTPLPPPSRPRFEGIRCKKDPNLGRITTCTRFTTTP